jgi:hypothetical protein
MLTRRACLLGGTAAVIAPLTAFPNVVAAEFDPASPFPHKDTFFPLNGFMASTHGWLSDERLYMDSSSLQAL